MVPQNFEQWEHCITVGCGIALTPQFAINRLEIYNQPTHRETQQFARLYGPEHLTRIVSWLNIVANGQEPARQ